MAKLKVYNIKCYISNKGVKTDKEEHIAFKEGNDYHVLHTLYKSKAYDTISFISFLMKKDYKVKSNISFGVYEVRLQNDRTFIGETWCKVGDYKKARLKLIEMLKEKIPYMLIVKKELEDEIKISKKKLMDYKKGLSVFINKSK